ncbi:MAG TPA: phosphotransferase [Anaerolineales bacterium]|nr:phosphotransferase [Anaerolineales bacterium]
MLEKPNIPDELIISCVQEGYDLRVSELTFIPIGADSRTAVYRAVSDESIAHFLKLRKNFDEVIVRVPAFLKESGVGAILVPLGATSQQLWADFGEYKIILYPFIEGKNGFEMELSDLHRQSLGAALKEIHTAKIPSHLRSLVRKETFNAGWREDMRQYQAQAAKDIFTDPTAAKLAAFIRSKQNEITRVVEQSEQLADTLRSRDWDFVLCHSDIHGGNILIGDTGELYIVDWDDPILAPKERDLMFIGGGIDELWKSEEQIEMFYQGYGNAQIDLAALAYYRYERVIEDLVVICDLLLPTDEGGEDRERSYGWFTSNFEPGQTVEIADRTAQSIR